MAWQGEKRRRLNGLRSILDSGAGFMSRTELILVFLYLESVGCAVCFLLLLPSRWEMREEVLVQMSGIFREIQEYHKTCIIFLMNLSISQIFLKMVNPMLDQNFKTFIKRQLINYKEDNKCGYLLCPWSTISRLFQGKINSIRI